MRAILFSMRLVSWNVNGIRAVHKKGLLQPLIDKVKPDVLCLQETKAQEDDLDEEVKNPPGYISLY